MNLIFVNCNLLLFLTLGSAFNVQHAATVGPCQVNRGEVTPRSRPLLFSSPRDEEKIDSTIDDTPVPTPENFKSVSEPEGTSYPIDLPSPLLLATSMILAIVGTGSAFDLGGGSPSLGFGPTAAIATVTIPLCLFLFYASILKATAETEADDREFTKGKY